MDRVVALSFKSFGPGFSGFSDVRFECSGFIRICSDNLEDFGWPWVIVFRRVPYHTKCTTPYSFYLCP